jgi:hypothetical protein
MKLIKKSQTGDPKKINILSFLIGIFSFINVTFIGQITVSEIIIVLISPWIILKVGKLDNAAFKKNRTQTIGLIIIWILGILISDYYNNNTIDNFIRGIGHPFFILLTFLTFQYFLQYSRQSLTYLLSGIFFSSLLFYFIDPFAKSEFRFGILVILTYFGAIISVHYWAKKRRTPSLFIFSILSVIALVSGGRSNFLILFTIIFFILLANKYSKNNLYFQFKQLKRWSLFLIAAILVAQLVYTTAVENKIFSEKYQEKFEQQKESGLPVIFSGRPELFSSLAAIKDSPIFGHGSWAKGAKYYEIYYNAQSFDYTSNQSIIESMDEDRIPSHSFFFGAWVENGILAMLFFLFFGKKVLNVLVYYLNNSFKSETPFILLIIVTVIWHFFFSPLGSDKRIFVALILALNSFYISFKFPVLNKAHLHNISNKRLSK